MKSLLLLCSFFLSVPLMGQAPKKSRAKKSAPKMEAPATPKKMDKDAPDPLPFAVLPDYPDEYTPETVVARMVEGLGFRYHWATDGLRRDDLLFKPNADARTTLETLEHIHGLSEVIVNAVRQQPNRRGTTAGEPPAFAVLRRQTLDNLEKASDLLRSGRVKLEDCDIVFQSPDSTSEHPFWHTLNGPLADALWHTGQVVSFRRSSGNPFNSKVNLFSGTVRE